MHLKWAICLDLFVAGENAEKNNPLMFDDKYLRFSFHCRFFLHYRLAMIFLRNKPFANQTTEKENRIVERLVWSFCLEVLLSGKLIHILFWEAPILWIPLFSIHIFFSLTGSKPSDLHEREYHWNSLSSSLRALFAEYSECCGWSVTVFILCCVLQSPWKQWI